MNLFDPHAYIREQCMLLDLPISMLCRRAGVSRASLYRWEGHVPESIHMLAKVEETFEKVREKKDSPLLEAVKDKLDHVPSEVRQEITRKIYQILQQY